MLAEANVLVAIVLLTSNVEVADNGRIINSVIEKREKGLVSECGDIV